MLSWFGHVQEDAELQRPQRRFMSAVQEDVQRVSVTEEDVRGASEADEAAAEGSSWKKQGGKLQF